MAKIDFKKELKTLYNASLEPCAIDVPKMNYLMIDGTGDPATSKAYLDAVGTLFPLSYAIKFLVKKKGTDYGVMPLEGLWWADDMEHFMDDRSAWQWTSMVMQPSIVTEDIVEEALEQVKKKKDLPVIDKVRFEAFSEGRSAQVMHVGPFSTEGPTVTRLHGFIAENGFEQAGKHHEIYLNDVRKVAPERMKTILRQPMKRK